MSACKGDWDADRNFSDGGLAASPNAATLLSSRVKLEYESGQFDEGARFLERLLATAHSVPRGPVFEHASVASAIPIVARITCVLDRFDVAERAAETLLSSPHASPTFSFFAQSGLALMAVMLEDTTKCEETYYRLLPDEVSFRHPTVRDLLLGLLARGMGELDKSIDHFEHALSFCRQSGFRPDLAWSCQDYADTLQQRNGPEMTIW